MRIPIQEFKLTLYRILREAGVPEDSADLCAGIFTANQRDGIDSHGLNRFPDFLRRIREGQLKHGPESRPQCVHRFGALEQWDGKMGLGPVNATHCMRRALEIAYDHGIGCVGLANTNHWMRAGTYSLQAADAGYIGLCWTNTIPLMPPWGAEQKAIGNNPLSIALPRSSGPVLLDMAMSQFSNGRLEIARRSGKELPVPGGFDANGNLSTDPDAILTSQRALPIGYWKGSALAVVLDMLATLISGGQSSSQIGAQLDEYAVSQVFMAVALQQLTSHRDGSSDQQVDTIIRDLHAQAPNSRYPGERMLQTRATSLRRGVRVEASLWNEIKRGISP
jgi:3-dehydro-L-gulonate 2-dehydrogenase